MSNNLNITMAQINPILGNVEANTAKIIEIWSAHDDQSDLILFPELFLCGYPPEDLSHNQAFIATLKAGIHTLIEKSKAYKSAAIIPTIWYENNHIYNAGVLVEHGIIKHVFKKHHLPNYNVFDEARNFSSASLPFPYDFRGHRLGIMICEDLWYDDVSANLKSHNAEILIAINGSPYHIQKQQERSAIAQKRVLATGLNLIYLNMIGGQDELVFDGQSFIMNDKSEIIFQGCAFEEEVTHITIQAGIPELNIKCESNTPKTPFNNDLYNALIMGMRDYVHKNGFKDVLLGLSGGIDSALVAAIAVDALGARHVRCIMLPSEFTSQDSLDDAAQCAKQLGVDYTIIPIKDAVKTFETLIPNLNGLAHENTQSRIRGTILMALSNMSGSMLLTTGNKSEMAVGYCTLYGDMNGGFNPIKDIYKTQVYALSTWRNTISEVIPKRIIIKPPSAELRPDQTDQDSLPPYDLLDDILYLLIECDGHDWNKNTPQHMLDIKSKCEQHPDVVAKVARLLNITEYKRYQAPPGTRVTPKAFGRDRRYPMINHFVNRIENLSE